MPSRPVIRRPFQAVAFLLLLLLGPAAPAAGLHPQDEVSWEDARVARALGEALFMGARDERWHYAQRNLPVERGDLFVTGTSGEMTLEFRGGVLVDLDHGTRLAVADAARGPHLRLDHGAIYLVLLNNRTAYERVRVSWEGGSLYLGDRGSYRLDRFADGTVRALVLRGRARVRSGGGGRHLDPGEAILIRGSRFASRETSYRPGDYDRFDREVIDRHTGIFGYRPPRHFPHVIVGLWELDTHGTWVYVPAWGTHGWKPRNPGPDWRPYRQGRWRRTPRGGWAWIPAEPWGHTTCHYGAWAYLAGHGWIWKPGRTYSDARVRWIRSGNYLGWAPLGPSGKPVAPGAGKSPFLFVQAGDLQAERPVEPVTGQPVAPDAPSADDPDSLLPDLPVDGAGSPARDPEADAAAKAAADADAAGREAAGARGESVREAAEAAGVLLPPAPEDGVAADAEGEAEEDATAPGAAELLPGEPEPSPPVADTGPVGAPAPVPMPGAGEAPGPAAGGPDEAVPAEDESAMPAGTAPAPPPDVVDEAPGTVTEEAPAAAIEAEPADAVKAASEAERAQRRSENEAKKAGERAEREAEKQLKARGRRGSSTADETGSGGEGAAPGEANPSAD